MAQIITTSIGLAITWLVMGLWHGASWNFILYGVYYGTFIIMGVVLENVYEKLKIKLHINSDGIVWRGFSVLRTFSIVCFGYILFRSASLGEAFYVAGKVLTFFSNISFSGIRSCGLSTTDWVFLFLYILCLFLTELTQKQDDFVARLHRLPKYVRWLFLYLLITLFIYFTNWNLSAAGNFLYFNF